MAPKTTVSPFVHHVDTHAEIMPCKTYDSESDEEYSYGFEDFKMQVDALGTLEQFLFRNLIDR